MAIWNPTAKKTERAQPSIGLIEAKLRDISEYFSVGQVPPNIDDDKTITLWTNPQSISWGRDAVWGQKSGHLSSIADWQYGYSRESTVSLGGCIVDTQCSEFDAQEWVDRLVSYARPGTNTNPPILSIVFGSRLIYPVILTRVGVQETAWANGYVNRAELELTFERIELSAYRSTADARRVTALTEREKDRAKKLAESELKKPSGTQKPTAGTPRTQSTITQVPNVDQRAGLSVGDTGLISQGQTVIAQVTKLDVNQYRTPPFVISPITTPLR